MQWTIGRKIAAGFALPLVILVVIGWFSYRSTTGLIETSQLVTHTHKVLQELEGVLSALVDAETGARGYVITGEEPFLEPYHSAIPRIQEGLIRIGQLTADNPNQQRRMDILKPLINTTLAFRKALIDARKTKGFKPASDMVLSGEGKKEMDEIRKVVAEMQGEEHALLKERDRAAQATAQATIMTIGIGTLLAFLVVAVAGVFIVRRVTSQILDGVNVLVSSAVELTAAMTQQASGNEEEATAVQETSTTVDEVRQTVQVSSQKARAVAEAAQKTAQVSQSGRRSVEESIRGIQDAKAKMEELAQRILVLSERGQAIAEITATVNDLAEQSNLLAVNAAIEAAKAGDAGKGFAVVASEVKALAEQSKQATAQVRGILNEIQQATQAAVMAAEQGIKASEAGAGVASQAGEAIRLLAEHLSESSQAAQQIVATAQQQVVGMDQIALAMQNIQQASSQNMASTRQAERAARDLNELARRLALMVVADGSVQPSATSHQPLTKVAS